MFELTDTLNKIFTYKKIIKMIFKKQNNES